MPRPPHEPVQQPPWVGGTSVPRIYFSRKREEFAGLKPRLPDRHGGWWTGSHAAAFALASALCAVLLAFPCAGEEKSDTKKAKEAFSEATALYNEGKYPQAVVKFHDAYDLSPQPELLYNIAICYEKMGQTGNAIEYYGLYLDSKEKEDEDSAKVKKKVEKLKKKEAGEGGEEEEEEDEEEEEEEGKPKGAWLKKLDLPEDEKEEGGEKATGEKAAWKHGLRFILAGHLSNEPALHFEEPGWSARLGYNYRFHKGKGSLIVEAGYGMVHLGYFQEDEFQLALVNLMVAWEVLEVKERFFQLFLGGGLEVFFKFGYHNMVNPESKEAWLLGLPAMAEGQINVKPNLGVIIGLVPMFCITGKRPNWALGFIVKAGLVWGLKKKK
jgi:tetratricopeptide (TPR) repeat protein